MKKLFAGCVAVSFAAMLAACGDDSSSTSPGTSGNESSSSLGVIPSSSSGQALSGDSHEGASSSSSSIAPESSSSEIVNQKGFLWDGSERIFRVMTGSPDEYSGWWYEYNDNNDLGSSTLEWPSDVEDGYINYLEVLIEAYDGFKGKVRLGPGYDYPYAGLAFTTWNLDQEGSDITEWEGICVEYESDVNFRVMIHAESGTQTTHCELAASVGASKSRKVVDIPWNKFGSSCGAGIGIDAAKVLANAAVVKLEFYGDSGTVGKFFFTKVGSLGRCGAASAPESSSSVAPKSSSSVEKTEEDLAKSFLWVAQEDEEGRVQTGSPEETAGWWYFFDDKNDGGKSKIDFSAIPATCGNSDVYACIVEAYGALKVDVALGAGAEKPYVGLGFNVWNEAQKGVDVSAWGGICLVYESDLPFAVRLVPENDGGLSKYVDLSASVAASGTVKEIDIPWSRFFQWSSDDDLKKVAALQLRFEGAAGDTGSLRLIKLGSIGQCQTFVPAGP